MKIRRRASSLESRIDSRCFSIVCKIPGTNNFRIHACTLPLFLGLVGVSQYFETLNPEPIHSIRGLTVSQWRDTVRRELVLGDESGIWELASCEGIEGERSGPWHQSGQRHCGDLWHKQGD
jgi:hypothetical protein